MIVLKILLGILLVFLALLCIPVVVEVSFIEDFSAWIKVLFYKKQIYPMAEKPEKPKKEKNTAEAKTKKTKKKKKSQKKSAEETAGASKKSQMPEMKFSEMVDYALDFLHTLGKYTKKLLRCFLIYDTQLAVHVAAEDAAVAAIKTGQYNAYLHGVYAFLCNLFRTKNISITVSPDFTGAETKIYFHGKLRVIPLILLFIIIGMTGSFIIKLLKILLENFSQKGTQKNKTNIKNKKAVQSNEPPN